MYCENCGEKLKNSDNQKKPANYSINEENLPRKYKPITMWGYFLYQILFAIPIIGWILLLIFAFGGNENINVRNFARSYFCILIIGGILFLLFFVFF